MRLRALVLLLTPLAMTAVACEPAADVAEIAGSVTGANVPAQGKAFIVWVVSSTDPDHAYKFGEGPASQGRFTVGPLGEPPSQALNSYPADARIGVGIVALAGADASLPDGVLPAGALTTIHGFSTRHAVIWKKGQVVCSGDPRCDTHWMQRFPAGMSCGRCVPKQADQPFDTYEPVSCREITIETAPDTRQLRGCNWT